MRFVTTVLLVLPIATVTASISPVAAADPAPFKAGVATRVITPDAPMWMAGYGNRDHPSEGAQHDLTLNALALEDAYGTALVLVTSDLIGIPREFGENVAAEVQRRAGIPRERLMLTASGTYAALLALVTWQALRGQALIHPDGATLAAAGAIAAAGVLGVGLSLRGGTPPGAGDGTGPVPTESRLPI